MKRVADERIVEVLHALGLDRLLADSGGLHHERDFGAHSSSREQQLLAFARILLAAPRFVFLDRVGAMLGPEQTQKMLGMLAERSSTVLHAGEADEPRDLYDAILETREDGSWTWFEHGDR
jgi:vitamin B12/bleomycin/antimicrobial peptide transport system ATP-binding/permease protein